MPKLLSDRFLRCSRFGLRTVFVLLTLFCVWLGGQVNRVWHQRTAVERILELGGDVMYDFQAQRDADGWHVSPIPNAAPWEPRWVSRLIGIDFFHLPLVVSLQNHEVTDDDLLLLGRVPSFEFIYLVGADITNEGLRHLEGLKSLKMLELDGAKIDDEGLKHLKCHHHLRGLGLMATKITDAGLVHLRELTELDGYLNLAQTQISDAGLASLTHLNRLEILDTHGTNVTSAGLRQLRESLPNLK